MNEATHYCTFNNYLYKIEDHRVFWWHTESGMWLRAVGWEGKEGELLPLLI